MSTPIMSQIIAFGCNFAPRGWASCDGTLLPIAQNSALFALLGTTYGGNGQTTFGLPDLRGRMSFHFGQGPGLANYTQGQMGGTQTVAILPANMPSHTHALTVAVTQGATAGPGSTDSPVGNIPSASSGAENYAPAAAKTGNTAPLAVTATAAATGGSTPIGIMPPYIVVNWCIATQGIFPSRN